MRRLLKSISLDALTLTLTFGDDDDNIEIVVIKVHNKMPYLIKLQDLSNLFL